MAGRGQGGGGLPWSAGKGAGRGLGASGHVHLPWKGQQVTDQKGYQLGGSRVVLMPLPWSFTGRGLEGAAGSCQGKGTSLQVQALCSVCAVGLPLPPLS